MQPYRAMLAHCEVHSLRRNCFDNAVIESVLSILKAEYFHLATLSGVEELESGGYDYTDYYNRKRIKIGFIGLSPEI